MDKITINTDFIKLGQLLKLAGVVSMGAEAKYYIKSGKVKLNGEICLERGKKIFPGDIVTADSKEIQVIN